MLFFIIAQPYRNGDNTRFVREGGLSRWRRNPLLVLGLIINVHYVSLLWSTSKGNQWLRLQIADLGWESGGKEIGQARCSNCQWETSYLTAEEHLWAQKNDSWNPWEEKIVLGALLKKQATLQQKNTYMWAQKNGYSGWETDSQLLWQTKPDMLLA